MHGSISSQGHPNIFTIYSSSLRSYAFEKNQYLDTIHSYKKAVSISTMSIFDLKGKVAIVTKGIGAATCLALAKAGASVVLNYSSDAASANQVVEKIGSNRALAIKGDAGSVAFVEELVKQTVQKFSKIDILIPNAGVLPMTNLESTTEDIFDKCFSLNVKGPFFLVQKAAPYMPEGARVILLSTTQNVASTVTPPYLLYNALKVPSTKWRESCQKSWLRKV